MDLLSVVAELRKLPPSEARRWTQGIMHAMQQIEYQYEALERCRESYERQLGALRALVRVPGLPRAEAVLDIHKRVFRGQAFSDGCFLDMYADLHLFYLLGDWSESRWNAFKDAFTRVDKDESHTCK